MGEVKAVLAETVVPDREPHNARMFIDICENIHIHYREFRQVFSLDEYFEYADILERATQDVRGFLAQNPSYREGAYPTTIMIASGNARKRKFLENSPAPTKSAYFNNRFAIELQDESEVDEMHVHWRDYRLVLPREHFRVIAAAFAAASQKLGQIEATQGYDRKPNPDRDIRRARNAEAAAGENPRMMGVQQVPLSAIRHRYKDITQDFPADPSAIKAIKEDVERKGEFFPILVSTERDGSHLVIDGNHRLRAAVEMGLQQVPCVIAPIAFDQTDDFRRAESLLKRFDASTGFRFGVSAFNKEWLAFKLNRYYEDVFYRLVRRARAPLRGLFMRLRYNRHRAKKRKMREDAAASRNAEASRVP